MRGRWAAGIVPRNFSWILQDRLAVSERPGGYAPHHRKVRRHEEILWLSAQGFTRVVSLLPSTHNLHAYEELSLPASHFPLPAQADVRAVLEELYPALLQWIRQGERVLVHQEELGERVAGVIAGLLCWSGVLPEPPRATSAVEQLLRRQMGSAGRAIVAIAAEIPGPTGPVVPDVPAALLGAVTPNESGTGVVAPTKPDPVRPTAKKQMGGDLAASEPSAPKKSTAPKQRTPRADSSGVGQVDTAKGKA